MLVGSLPIMTRQHTYKYVIINLKPRMFRHPKTASAPVYFLENTEKINKNFLP